MKKLDNLKKMESGENESYSSEVWLISGLFNSLPGILTLSNGKLVFTALGAGTYWESGLKKIEKKSGAKDFCASLKRNKTVKLFSVGLSAIQKVTFPFIYFSAGAHITFNNEKYRLSFIEPNNTKMPVLNRSQYDGVVKTSVEIIQDIGHARKVGKKWKLLLIPNT